MKQQDELLTVQTLSGAQGSGRITVNRIGWTGRVYLVDGGKIVFKFPRNRAEQKNFAHEIKVLRFLKPLAFSLSIPRIAWQGAHNEYFGFYGVSGDPLRPETVRALTDEQKKTFGARLGLFLKELHAVEGGFINPASGTDLDRLTEYRIKLKKAEDVFKARFTEEETDRIETFFTRDAPERLSMLGQDLVFCHGDFGYNNIVLDHRLTPGVIDFGDAGLADRSKDFIDLDDKTVLTAALGAYGSHKGLLEKILIWQKLLPVFLMLFYIDRKEPDGVNECVEKMKRIDFTIDL